MSMNVVDWIVVVGIYLHDDCVVVYHMMVTNDVTIRNMIQIDKVLGKKTFLPDFHRYIIYLMKIFLLIHQNSFQIIVDKRFDNDSLRVELFNNKK
jgi:hypothetical protein